MGYVGVFFAKCTIGAKNGHVIYLGEKESALRAIKSVIYLLYQKKNYLKLGMWSMPISTIFIKILSIFKKIWKPKISIRKNDKTEIEEE